MLAPRRALLQEGFTLVEVMVASTVLMIVMSAMGPLFYGAMRLTGLTDQRSQATNLAVAATEQMRSLPYSEVGFHSTPGACPNNGQTPVTLTAPGPLDTLPTSTVLGRTTYTTVRCVYWSASSMPGNNQAYKQTLVRVSWSAPSGPLTVGQASALYPGGPPPTSPPPPVTGQPINAPSCSASAVSTDPPSINVTWTPAPTGEPASYFVVYYTTYNPAGAITSGTNPYSTVSNVSGTSYLATVGAGATYYFQVVAVGADGTASNPSATCSAPTSPGTVTTTTHPSRASATGVELALGGTTVPYTVPSPTQTASNDGTQPDQVSSAPIAVSVPGADSFLTVTGASDTAAAEQVGTSYACSGILSTGQSLSGGSPTAPCSVSGTGSGGISLNLMGLPGVGAAVSSLVGGLTLELSSATAWAGDNAGGTSASGCASLSGASIQVTPLGGLVGVQNIPLSLPAALCSPTDMVSVITAAIAGDPPVSSLGGPLQTALTPVLSLTAAYPGSGGDLTMSALHIAVLSGAGTGDLASVTVGHNSTTTTTTTPPCRVYSLTVSPGSDGNPVALTSTGTLADETSFQLAVNVGAGCSNIEVGYAPSGCTPAAGGCTTSYAAVTPPVAGGSGTFYGTAGTASTVWAVGTTSFTVVTGSGSTPAVYSPLIQQNVMLCTEKGTSGQC